VVEHIGRLDFARATRDLVDGIDAVRADPRVDASQTIVWGYCTGATLAWLAACQRGDIAAAVLYFPSQPQFHDHGPNSPVDPVDLLWQLTAPTLLLYGDQDFVMTSQLLNDVRQRVQRWNVDLDIKIYEGAGHSFTNPRG
jgi:carboxymethylenebutenolidase